MSEDRFEEKARELWDSLVIFGDIHSGEFSDEQIRLNIIAITTALQSAYYDGIERERAMNELVKIGQEIEAVPLCNGYWSVTVSLNGEEVVTIEPSMLSGREIHKDEQAAILEGARNLYAFLGVRITEHPMPDPDLNWLPPEVKEPTDV